MKKMRKIVIAAVFFSGATIMAQEKPEPRFEKDADLIKGTFYYEDGSIEQEGTYKNGELHGKWISYNQTGEKKAIAQYTFGDKTGKWFFWNNGELTEVTYHKNKIAGVVKHAREYITK